MSYGGDSNKKKKIAIVVVSSFILVVIGVAVTVGVTRKHNNDGSGESQPATTNKAVQEMCQSTDYRDQCVESLSAVGENEKDPKQIVKVGFEFVKKKLNQVAESSATLKEAEKDPMAKQALSICRELMELAVDHLENSFNKINAFEISKIDEILADVETWIGTVITYQGTCLDGFEDVTSPAAPKIQEAINGTMKFSTNVMMLVNQLNSMLSSMKIPGINSRRLLQEEVLGHGEFPLWMDPIRRRLLTAQPVPKPNLVIAQDGSGDARSFTEAIPHLPKKSDGPFVVHVKAGIYRETVIVPKDVWNITWIGDGADTTKVTFNKGYTDGIKTYYTSTFTLVGPGHSFRDIGFENSAGAIKHQAVAIVIDGDRTAFYNCRFDGHQDTLYAHGGRQFYRDCTITGTIDFIFGDARALLQNCLIQIRRPLDNQQNIVVASGKQVAHSPTGIILQNCTITADASLAPVKAQFRSYLARPWKEHAKTVYMQNFIDDVIHPDGWFPWQGTFALNTCFFSEFNNRGPGSDTSRRVKWPGIKTISPAQALQYTGKAHLSVDNWLIRTGFPYHSGMM